MPARATVAVLFIFDVDKMCCKQLKMNTTALKLYSLHEQRYPNDPCTRSNIITITWSPLNGNCPAQKIQLCKNRVTPELTHQPLH